MNIYYTEKFKVVTSVVKTEKRIKNPKRMDKIAHCS